MGAEELVIRVLQDGDEIAVNEAFNRIHGGERSLAEWSWLFPVSSKGRAVTIGLRGGRVVAHWGGVPVGLLMEGRERSCLMSRDVFSAGDDSHAESGTVEAFVEGATRAGELVLLTGSDQSMPSWALAAPSRWTELKVQSAVLSRQQLRTGRLRRVLYRAELARDWEPRLDDLWQRVKGAYPLCVVRNSEHALGRWAGHPRLRFHRFLVFPRFSRRPVAWVVFESGDGICRWMDLVWDRRAPGALEMVSHLSTRYCLQMGVRTEEFLIAGDPEATERLGRLGFEAGSVGGDRIRALVSGAEVVGGEAEPSFYLTRCDLEPGRPGLIS